VLLYRYLIYQVALSVVLRNSAWEGVSHVS
jgi:hypothetical protein